MTRFLIRGIVLLFSLHLLSEAGATNPVLCGMVLLGVWITGLFEGMLMEQNRAGPK
jgi:hypothetical protein